MPMIQIEILKGRSDEKKRKMMKDMTDACAAALGCPKSAVKIMIREMEHNHWCVGGEVWDEQTEAPYSM